MSPENDVRAIGSAAVGSAKALPRRRSTNDHPAIRDAEKGQVVARTDDVLHWVRKVRSWIPSWHRGVEAVLTEANGVTAVEQPRLGGLQRVLDDAASLFESSNQSHITGLQHAIAAHPARAPDAESARTRWFPQNACEDLKTCTANAPAASELVGVHVTHLLADLSEAVTLWPKDDSSAETISADARATLDALRRALMHALFVTFLDDARHANIGERVKISDYCSGWKLSDDEVDTIWLWVSNDPLAFGHKALPLVLDRENRWVYRRGRGWSKLVTSTAAIWGAAAAFGLVAGLFLVLHLAGLTKWPTHWPWKMLVLLLFVTLGAGLHVFSRSLSSISFDDPLKVYVAATTVDGLSLRWLAILRLYIPVTFVVASLWGAGSIPGSFQALGTAILAGYTADSVFRSGLSKVQAKAQEPEKSKTKSQAAGSRIVISSR